MIHATYIPREGGMREGESSACVFLLFRQRLLFSHSRVRANPELSIAHCSLSSQRIDVRQRFMNAPVLGTRSELSFAILCSLWASGGTVWLALCKGGGQIRPLADCV